MDMLQELKELGVSTDEGIARLNGNASLYERMLKKFVGMMDDAPKITDFDGEEYEDTINSAHTIKGVSGNLSLTPLYEAYSEIVRLLRAGEPEQAKQIFEKILPVQDEIIACIKKHS